MTEVRQRVHAAESAITYAPEARDLSRWQRFGVRAELAKWDASQFAAEQRDRLDRVEDLPLLVATVPPLEVVRFGKPTVAGGLLTNIGGNFLTKLLRGDITPSGTGGSAAAPSMSTDGTLANERFFNNTNTKVGIGTQTTAAAQSDLDLNSGGTRTRLAMVSGFPKIKNDTYVDAAGATITVSDRQFVVSGIAGTSDANNAWQEFTISNGGAATGIIEATPGQAFTILDRFVSNQGTKVSGQIWQVWITVTLS